MNYQPLSPLKYPGGKFRALSEIISRVPTDIQEYREPLLGGGSVFFELRNRRPPLSFWINDLNPDLIAFYNQTKKHGFQMGRDLLDLKHRFRNDGRVLLDYAIGLQSSEYDRALRFFILNRITFNGIGLTRMHTSSKSYSEIAFRKKFTTSVINRVPCASGLLDGVRITNSDYEELLFAPGKDVFLFLDPPYLLQRENSLYGERGTLHKGFNYEKLSNDLRACPHRWLMTLNDCPEIRDIFSWAELEPFTFHYSMQNWRQGKELFISNYKPKIFRNVSLIEYTT